MDVRNLIIYFFLKLNVKMLTSTEVLEWKTVEERKCLVMHLQSDQTRGEVTSCMCVGWGVVDSQLAAVALDMMQR